jgi:hypothetical protein
VASMTLSKENENSMKEKNNIEMKREEISKIMKMVENIIIKKYPVWRILESLVIRKTE